MCQYVWKGILVKEENPNLVDGIVLHNNPESERVFLKKNDIYTEHRSQLAKDIFQESKDGHHQLQIYCLTFRSYTSIANHSLSFGRNTFTANQILSWSRHFIANRGLSFGRDPLIANRNLYFGCETYSQAEPLLFSRYSDSLSFKNKCEMFQEK